MVPAMMSGLLSLASKSSRGTYQFASQGQDRPVRRVSGRRWHWTSVPPSGAITVTGRNLTAPTPLSPYSAMSHARDLRRVPHSTHTKCQFWTDVAQQSVCTPVVPLQYVTGLREGPP